MLKLNKSVVLSLFCNLFHYYAFSIYAFSAVILAPIFFHIESQELTRILGLITLSILLLLKPLGGIVFGHIGDRYGRKVALTFSLVAITISTTCIGLIPSFEYIGWFSSVTLMICLFIQGMCMGGQSTGSIIFIQEHTKKHNAAFSCALMITMGVFGTLLGTATSFLSYHLGGLRWEWRLPFLLTSIMGICLYFLMKNMQETPVFAESKNQSDIKKIPLVNIIKNHKKTLCAAIFISSIPVSMFYLATVYMPNFYGSEDRMSNPSFSLILVCLAQILCMIFIPLFGYIADKLGKETQLKVTSILLILSPIFVFYGMSIYNNTYFLIFGIIILSIFASLYSGPAPAFLSEKFPVVGRFSGMGLSIAIGEGLFGGLSPIICVGIEQIFQSKIAPAYFIMFLGMISFSGVLILRKKTASFLEDKVMNTPQVSNSLAETYSIKLKKFNSNLS